MSIKQDHSDRAHSILGASSSSRWMNCPGSVPLIESLGDLGDKSSPYAEEGTAAHELAEYCILENIDPISLIYGEKEFNGYTVTKEMAEAVSIYTEYISKRLEENELADVLVEERFDLSYIREDMFGTNDGCIVDWGRFLEITDLKYGMGVRVEATNNTQLLYYALGAYRKLDTAADVPTIRLTIVQPRQEDPIRTWEISTKRLLEFEDELKKAVERINEGDMTLEMGDHCRFCPAKAICPAQKELALKTATVAFNEEEIGKEVNLPEVEGLPDWQVGKIVQNIDHVKKWLDSVSIYAKIRMEKGIEISGLKMVRRRTIRRYENEKDVIEAFEEELGDEIYDKKLKSLTKLEKIVGKDVLKEYIIKPEGELTVAPRSDSRKEVEIAPASSHFDLIEEENNQELDLDF